MNVQPNYNNLSRKFFVICGVFLFLLAFLQATLLKANTHWMVGAPIIATIITTALYWHLRMNVWFWVIIAPIVVGEGILCFLIPLPYFEPAAPVLIALAIVDTLLMMMCVKVIGPKVGNP